MLLLLNTQAKQAQSEPELRAPEQSPKELGFAPDRILVKPEVNAPADTVASLNHENDAQVEETISHSRVRVVDLPTDLPVAEAVERYEDSPDIAYAEPDYVIYPAATPDDRNYPQMYGLDNTRQFNGTLDSDIDAPQAWNVTTGNADTVVAVIDTGVDISHPDLRDNIWTNPDEIPRNNKDDDRNGYKDDVHGWDFLHDDATVYDSAEDSHGTHVAGTLAAEGNNGLGITGVAWQAEIMPLMIFSSDSVTYLSDAVEATNYAVAEGATISNNSWGSSTFSHTLLEAINKADAAGHLYVAGAGNGGADSIGDNNAQTPFYPASYDSPNIISVAASDQHDNLASFSNYGATSVDLAAPGVEIYSTRPENTYGYGYGTSMATPHVSGTAALIKSRFPYLDDVEIKSRILRSVDQRRNLKGKLVTGGRLNAARALGVNMPPPRVLLLRSRDKGL